MPSDTFCPLNLTSETLIEYTPVGVPPLPFLLGAWVLHSPSDCPSPSLEVAVKTVVSGPTAVRVAVASGTGDP